VVRAEPVRTAAEQRWRRQIKTALLMATGVVISAIATFAVLSQFLGRR
jgi:hypothetical protein